MMLRILTAAVTTALLFAPVAVASELSNTTPTTGSHTGSTLFASSDGAGYGSSPTLYEKWEAELLHKGYSQKDATAIAWGSIDEDLHHQHCRGSWIPGLPHTDDIYTCPDTPVTLGEWISAILHFVKALLGLAEPAR